jgi:hypothetical protein
MGAGLAAPFHPAFVPFFAPAGARHPVQEGYIIHTPVRQEHPDHVQTNVRPAPDAAPSITDEDTRGPGITHLAAHGASRLSAREI